MCRYCKNLKRLKDLDEKEYLKIIDQWRERDKVARNLILHLVLELEEPSIGFDDYVDRLISKANNFLNQDYLGK